MTGHQLSYLHLCGEQIAKIHVAKALQHQIEFSVTAIYNRRSPGDAESRDGDNSFELLAGDSILQAKLGQRVVAREIEDKSHSSKCAIVSPYQPIGLMVGRCNVTLQGPGLKFDR